MESRAYALVTGLFVLGLAAAMVFWAHWLAREPLERNLYRVISTLPVSGLKEEGQVRYRGVDVGRVSRIVLDPKDARRIFVGIDVDATVPVTRGTYAQLGMEGITGIAYVQLLDEGQDPRPPAKGADGVPELELRPSFIDALSEGAEGAVREARELMAALRAILTPENRARIEKTLASLERVTASLEATSARLPGTLERLEARAQAWLGEDNRQLARRSLERFGEAAAALPELAREAQRLARETRALVGEVGKLSAEARAGIAAARGETLPRINALAEQVERGAERVGRLAAGLEREPSSVLWGRRAPRAGPGEPGFE